MIEEVSPEMDADKIKEIESMEKDKDRLIAILEKIHDDDLISKMDGIYREAMEKIRSRNKQRDIIYDRRIKRNNLFEEKKEIYRHIERETDPYKKSEMSKQLLSIQSKLDKLGQEKFDAYERARRYHEEGHDLLREYDRYRVEFEKKYGFSCIEMVNDRIQDINRRIGKMKSRYNECRFSDTSILLEHILSCPLTDEDEIRRYVETFAMENKIDMETNYLFRTFHLACRSEKPMINAGRTFILLSIINEEFEEVFIKNKKGFFKNVILSRGKSNIKIRTPEEYVSFEEDFRYHFKIPPPRKDEVLKAIMDHEPSIRVIVYNESKHDLLRAIFQKDCPELFQKLENSIMERCK